MEEAEKALTAVTAAVPDYVQAHVLLATVYYRLKKKDLAEQERATVAKLFQEKQGRELGAGESLGPAIKP